MHIYAFLLNINAPLFVNGFPKNVPKKRIFSPKTQIWGFFFIFGKIFGKRETCQPCGFEGIFMVFPKTGFGKYSMSLCKINYPNFVNDLQKELSFLKYLSATLFLCQISNYHHIHSKSSKILSR